MPTHVLIGNVPASWSLFTRVSLKVVILYVHEYGRAVCKLIYNNKFVLYSFENILLSKLKMLFKNQTLCCDDENKHSTMPWMFIEIFADISLVKAEIPLVTWFKWVYALVSFTKKKDLVMILLKFTIWFVQINIYVKHYLKLIVNSASQIITNWKLQVTIYVCLYQV